MTTAFSTVEQELQTYQSADSLVSGEGLLDEDKLNQQIRVKTNMKSSVEATAAIVRTAARSNPVATVVNSLFNLQNRLNQMSSNLQQDIDQLNQKLEKLNTFNSQTSGLFQSSLEDMKLAMQDVLVLSQTTVNSDGTYTLPSGVDENWADELKNRKKNKEFAKKYGLHKPKDMSEKQYQEYITKLRAQKATLMEDDGWDESAFKAYLSHVKKDLKKGGKALERLDEINESTRQVGSDVYTKMFNGTKLSDREKVNLVLDHMGGKIDKNNMLQLDGTHRFDPKMPPHSKFLEQFAESVIKAYPKGMILKEYDDVSEKELQKVFQFRHYIDLHNIGYIRSNYKGKTDYDKLLAYEKASGQKLSYRDSTQFHNRVEEEDTVLTSQVNDKIKTANGLSEFIINVEDGSFVSQWDQLKTVNGESMFITKKGKVTGIRYDKIESNPKEYRMTTQAGKEVADTESFNYDGGDNPLEKAFKIGKHYLFDMTNEGSEIPSSGQSKKEYRKLESDLRIAAKKEWPYSKKYKEEYKTRRDIKIGENK